MPTEATSEEEVLQKKDVTQPRGNRQLAMDFPLKTVKGMLVQVRRTHQLPLTFDADTLEFSDGSSLC